MIFKKQKQNNFHMADRPIFTTMLEDVGVPIFVRNCTVIV